MRSARFRDGRRTPSQPPQGGRRPRPRAVPPHVAGSFTTHQGRGSRQARPPECGEVSRRRWRASSTTACRGGVSTSSTTGVRGGFEMALARLLNHRRAGGGRDPAPYLPTLLRLSPPIRGGGLDKLDLRSAGEVSRRRWRASSTTACRGRGSRQPRPPECGGGFETGEERPPQPPQGGRRPRPRAVPPLVAGSFTTHQGRGSRQARPPECGGGFETALARLLNHRLSGAGVSTSSTTGVRGRFRDGAGAPPQPPPVRGRLRASRQARPPGCGEVSRRRWRASSTTACREPGSRHARPAECGGGSETALARLSTTAVQDPQSMSSFRGASVPRDSATTTASSPVASRKSSAGFT